MNHRLAMRAVAASLCRGEFTTGLAGLMLIDPDGNPVLIDQHIACPP
jgi:hypothetical protein